MVNSIDAEYDSCSYQFEYDHNYQNGSNSTGVELSYILNQETNFYDSWGM